MKKKIIDTICKLEGSVPNLIGTDSYDPFEAIKNINILDVLIEEIDPVESNSVDEYGDTILHDLIEELGNYPGIIHPRLYASLFLKLNCEIFDLQNIYGDTPLHQAIFCNNGYICELLIPKMSLQGLIARRGKNKDERNASRDAEKSNSGHIRDISNLIDKRIRYLIEYQREPGETSLHWAVRKNCKGICEEIIDEYPNILFVRNKNNQDSLDIAIEKGYKDIEELIRSKLMYTLSNK